MTNEEVCAIGRVLSERLNEWWDKTLLCQKHNTQRSITNCSGWIKRYFPKVQRLRGKALCESLSWNLGSSQRSPKTNWSSRIKRDFPKV